MKNIRNLIFISSFLIFSVLLISQGNAYGREVLSLDKGWRFHLGDIPFPVVKGHRDSYNNAKASRAPGAAAYSYDDSLWRILNLPHDWAVEGDFNRDANVSQGYRDRGIGWYRRQFELSQDDKGKHIELQIDGISTHATIWVNGTLLHRNFCGYTSMYIDITPYVSYGNTLNTIAIRVDADALNGWWYEGAGIYRHTWLVKRSSLHITTDGVYANPQRKSGNTWEIPIEVTLYNSDKEATAGEVEVMLLDAQEKIVAQGKQSLTIPAFRRNQASLLLNVSNPELWSVESPVLYKVKTIVKQNGVIRDEYETKCGFRTIRFDAHTGFWLNDKNIKIKGVSNHQDHAGVGVAVPDALWEFRLKRLKEMGVNGYRCAHNPVAKEFLDACDSLGILVMNENRLFNTAPENERQLEWLVRRDRNHPSVISWSIFNEESVQGTETGYQMALRLKDVVKRFDVTRPVTAGMNGGIFNPVNASQALDVFGFNYMIDSYDRFHEENPDLPVVSSEDGSAFMVRGEYITDRGKRLIDSYDTEHARWGASHRDTWKAIDERPWMAGGFYWTGFDYRGEPTPYGWPSASTFFGILDLCGFPKSAFYIHQALWREDIPVLQLIPHWNWPADSVGKPMKVMAFSNMNNVELKLNGKTISKEKVDKYEMNTWIVPYKPGKLEAIGYDKNNAVLARSVVETTGEPTGLKLTPYRAFIKNDTEDAIPITVEALDTKGRHVPTANFMINFSINGSGEIIGLGNGNPNSHEPEKGDKRSLFNGLAQVIIQNNGGGEPITLTATAEGMKPYTIIIPVIGSKQKKYMPVIYSPLTLNDWIQSQFFSEKPDLNQEIIDNDMNTWTQTAGVFSEKVKDARYIMFRTTFNIQPVNDKKEGKITFNKLNGKAEIWLNGKMIGTKNTYVQENNAFSFPINESAYDLRILIENETGLDAGFSSATITGARFK